MKYMMYIIEVVDEQKIQFFENYYEAVECVKALKLKGFGIVDNKRERFVDHYYLKKIY